MRGSTAFWGGSLCLTLLLGSACGDDDDPCAGAPVALPCDIRAASCRCTVFDATKRLRNQPSATIPPARVISRATFAEETRAGMGERMQSEGIQVYQAALRVLSLLPTTSSLDDAQADAEIAGVAAYYDPDDGAVTILADSAEDPLEGVFTLSHEYVHALQDQLQGFKTLYATEPLTDGAMSLKALTEGEAVLLSDLLLHEMQGRAFEASSLTLYERIMGATLDAIRESPAPLTEALLGMPYPVGARSLATTYLAGGLAGVSQLYPQRPRTFTGWFDLARAPSLPVPLSCARPPAPSGYRAWGADRMGGSAMPALGGRLAYDNAEMLELASSWSNDEFALYSSNLGVAQGVAVVWRVSFASEAVASKLETRLREAVSTLELTRTGSELLIIGASDASLLASWSTRNSCISIKGRDDDVYTRLVPDLTRHIHAPKPRASGGW